MASQFSRDGRYFARFSNDGKLQVWLTNDNKFDQEFTPDFHLTSPCTCLHFIERPVTNFVNNKNGSPKKKIRRQSISEPGTPYIVLGTNNGMLLVYCVAKGEMIFTINSNTNQPISCVSWKSGDLVYGAIEQFVFCWSIEKRNVKSKWATGNESISALLKLECENDNELLTASKNIKLWNINEKKLLKTFTGHSSLVTIMDYIKPANTTDAYLVTGAKGDRLLSCWNLNEKNTSTNAVANFIMEDIIADISHEVAVDGTTNVAALTRSGIVHIYRHMLNGKCGKPLRPKTTLQIASDSTGSKDKSVRSIPILNAVFNKDLSLTICYGFLAFLVFERVVVTEHEKVQCLIRKDIRQTKSPQQKNGDVTNIKMPVVDNKVEYLTPHTVIAHSATACKRKSELREVPMEKRLENLTLVKSDEGVPKAQNMAQLLVQGLHSKDKEILRTVLHVKDEKIIQSTVKRLPINVIMPLISELNRYLQGKTAMCNLGTLWLRHIMTAHSGILLSNPEISELITPVLSNIQNRLTLFTPMTSLKGRLELLASQLNVETVKEIEDEPVLIYNDKDSSDSEQEGMEINAHSESENEWDENSSSNNDEENEDMSDVEENNLDEDLST